MSTISNLIFKGANHYITSSYGARGVINTSAGKTSSFHYGTDYGTDGKKIPQYAIEDGVIIDCGRASDGANYVWVKYPRINKKMLHYHLDSISVKNGQSVKKGTLIGKTGKTGKATGVHLHLGVRDLSTGNYEDPEKLVYSDPTTKTTTASKPTNTTTTTTTTSSSSFLPKRGYFKKGDISANIGKIAKFMYATYPAYTKKSALGNVFGSNLFSAIKEFQKRTGLESDGNIGKLTLAMLVKNGFKY